MSDTVTVGEAEGTLRLDRWFRRHYPGLGHGRLEKLLRTGQVRVDGKKAKSGDRVSPGMAIRVPPLDDNGQRRPRNGARALGRRTRHCCATW
jgi:23S rRNA pseudouridine955/2504/2580 synthase